MNVEVYNLKNEVVSETELPAEIFAVPWKPMLVKQVIDAYLANKRRPWAHVKGRGEVRGGGRKPWRQKGTGRARHGSIRSPLWRGGGKAHGPVKLRDYSQKINKKMRRSAIFSVLSKKLKDGEVKVFENFELDAPKTKTLAEILKKLLSFKKHSKKFDVLLVAGAENKNLRRAASNLVKTEVLAPETLNVYNLLNYKNLFIEQKAIPVIGKHYKMTK